MRWCLWILSNNKKQLEKHQCTLLSLEGRAEQGRSLCPGGKGKLVVLGKPLILHHSCLPLFLLLIHGHSTWSQCHHQEQATDDGSGLEEVILKEVVHGFVGRDGPESIEVEVND